MHNSISLMLDSDSSDRPVHSLGVNDIPVLYLDKKYGPVRLQFRPDKPEQTITYLTALIEQASELLEKVKAANA